MKLITAIPKARQEKFLNPNKSPLQKKQLKLCQLEFFQKRTILDIFAKIKLGHYLGVHLEFPAYCQVRSMVIFKG